MRHHQIEEELVMSLGTIIWIAVAAYVVIAVLAFIFNASIGPVTPGLALRFCVPCSGRYG